MPFVEALTQARPSRAIDATPGFLAGQRAGLPCKAGDRHDVGSRDVRVEKQISTIDFSSICVCVSCVDIVNYVECMSDKMNRWMQFGFMQAELNYNVCDLLSVAFV